MAGEPGRQRITRELLFAAFAGPSTETDDPRLLERIAASVQAETVKAGHVLFREGDESHYVHFMSEGRMRLSRPGYADWVHEGRWVIGTTDVLVGRPRTRTAIMETDARLFRLPADHWFDVMQDRPAVVLNALVGFARGIVALHVQLAPDGGFAPPEPTSSPDVSSLAGRARVLASLPLLRGVPMQILVELASAMECRELEPKEGLFAAGVPPGRIFVVTRGRVEAVRGTEPTVTAVFATGSLVGGALCLGDSEAAWSARALERGQVLSFSVEDLFDHLEEHQDGVRAMMAAFALERERLCEELAARLGELVLH
jgi:CRP-like cAMP-binding protein